MNANKHSFLRSIRAWVQPLTSSRHFFRSSTASSRVIPERENIHRLISLEAISLRRKLLLNLNNFSAEHQNLSFPAHRKHFPDVPRTPCTAALTPQQAIENRFVTGNGKHDGILPPMARAGSEKPSHLPSPTVYCSSKSAPAAPAGCQARAGGGDGFSVMFLLGMSSIKGKARVGCSCYSHTSG